MTGKGGVELLMAGDIGSGEERELRWRCKDGAAAELMRARDGGWYSRLNREIRRHPRR